MMDNKYYLFRDLSHQGSLLNGKTFHASGLVRTIYSMTDTPSGKDLSVTYLDPFDRDVTTAWRMPSEVELFEVGEWEWEETKIMYDKIEGTL